VVLAVATSHDGRAFLSPGVTALLVGLVGVFGALLGIVVKALFDRANEKSRREREDVQWRRENALGAAADFLSATDLLHAVVRTVQDLTTTLRTPPVPLEQAATLRAAIAFEQSRQRQETERASDALSRLSILVSQETFLAASQLLEDVQMKPMEPTNAFLKAHLNDLLRADLGLPPRVIAESDGLSADAALAKIESERQRIKGPHQSASPSADFPTEPESPSEGRPR
jgi:hypothetical protein